MTEPSFHVRNRELLADLDRLEVVTDLLARVGERRSWPTDLTWRREWSRIDDPRRRRIRLIYRATNNPLWLCEVRVGADQGLIDPVLGRVAVRLFPDDDKLDTLRSVIAAHHGVDIVRYRPGKRCTMRVGGRVGHRSGAVSGPFNMPFYIKVFADRRGDGMFADGLALWQAAQSGSLGFDVARPLAADPDLRTYAQAEVAGRPVVDELYGPDGPRLAYRLGAATATIPLSSLRPRNEIDAFGELARSRRRSAEIASFAPILGPRLDALLNRLAMATDKLVDVRRKPIHGSPHPNQWLSTGPALGLIDFDRLSLGDPELDVATFAAEVDFEDTPERAGIVDAFEEGYRDRCGPLDPARLAIYRTHKRLAKVHRTAKSIRPDGDERAAAHLDLAATGLGADEGALR